jgi:hypothetical protein
MLMHENLTRKEGYKKGQQNAGLFCLHQINLLKSIAQTSANNITVIGIGVT